MKGRTTLVIAHRLSTVVDADKIIFIEKGNLTGSGTHDELLQTHDMYREFATQQLKIKEGHYKMNHQWDFTPLMIHFKNILDAK